jgi:NADPH-dependent 7-cyano-7-deazaguanine reductase QueF
MITTHEFTAQCTCPIDKGPDTYAVRIETDRVIEVEAILAAVAALRSEVMFQEEYTTRLARQVGARVTTVGYHSGVRTTCSEGVCGV